MGDKGLLTKTIEEKLSKKLDELVELGGVWETVDGLAFKLAISGLDDTLGEKVPEPFKTTIKDLLIDIIEEQDYSKATAKGFDFLDELIDIPGIDDAMEALLFKGMATIVIAIIVSLKKDEV